jgi:5-methylcytosine-specific restriction endonuclease McrA
MNDSTFQKRPRIRMAPTLYAKLRKEILQRDGWRCQKCGRSKNLDVHHITRRSALGDDAETNLITLCRACHQLAHGSLGPTSESKLSFFLEFIFE